MCFSPCRYHHQAKRTLHQFHGTQLPDCIAELQRSLVEKEKSGNDFCHIKSTQWAYLSNWSNSTNRKQIVIAACVGSFLIIIAILLLIEFLDRTLRDANRTKRVTGFKVIGAVPNPSSARYGGLTKTYVQLSVKELSNSCSVSWPNENHPGYLLSTCSAPVKTPVRKS